MGQGREKGGEERRGEGKRGMGGVCVWLGIVRGEPVQEGSDDRQAPEFCRTALREYTILTFFSFAGSRIEYDKGSKTFQPCQFENHINVGTNNFLLRLKNII
jgi:hypothetical protein